MADKQPPTVVEGATTGDVEDVLPTAKSAEDRKAASALASLDTASAGDEAPDASNVDKDAVTKAMKNLPGGGGGATSGPAAAAAAAAAAPARKTVKVDAADVALLVDQLDMSKPKATELLRAHGGNAVEAMLAYATS
ncbi:hypothetical protein ACRE_027390 [Hapsidospora chrysogenum ATCC 11550]|uniref:Nascent polypeptide-associated complex subunit alpha-like UBA domain-containing protein n=1 Tax=Hapsidospora chrysogenum (strain ATCC 11550 / CBS 779.69 / DSM 880 / IAM 14645 / JCM 23072 / IMI 49137) TaxID=857340 RepID=A0A086TAR5_HAPC1|nr:hypothetical protein ACRE_027390 [Hapsidospora chrysogenum ATCC 11550]